MKTTISLVPRGHRNNNPLNIRKGSIPFMGEKRNSTDPDFRQFIEMRYGYRAAFVIMASYYKKYNINTPEAIIRRWAPPTENLTESYITTVCQLSHLRRDQILTLSDGSLYQQLVCAMSMVENGIPADPNQVQQGFALQNQIS
jgi:hypothetical protein